MDEKLAKGLTREGFRKVDERHNLEGAEVALQLLRGHGRLIGKQKLSKAATQKSFETSLELFGRLPDTVFMQHHVDARTKKLSSDFKAFLLAGVLSYTEIEMEHQEQAIAYTLLAFQFSRREFKARELILPMIVRQHAVNRYIERGDRTFSSIGRALWPGLLFMEALIRWHKPMALQPFMIPTPNGAFLGLSIPGEPGMSVIQQSTYTGRGKLETTDQFRDSRSLRQWFLNTFISLNDMRDDQIALREGIIELIKRHEALLIIQHTMGVGIYDGMDVEVRLPDFNSNDDVDAAHESAERDFAGLFGGNLWRSSVRAPERGIFQKEIEFQKSLDRYGLDVLMRARGVSQEDLDQALREMDPEFFGTSEAAPSEPSGTKPGSRSPRWLCDRTEG
ncbi:hypothetical protein ASD99_08475 [Mesorhizobium sp. Root695]|uniref:hypothetical protein n=1 Tax=Mesorhizobium sp. Root695 TaxID=1736589 RepID=UPI000708A0B4|nr:hypothetical protein [Mesorhizobium sp. Root695]KRB16392.1 hypothetical protein ASD99_08475 [Mesorhizobium sp. Root695]